jgi:hypothetical protein
VKRRLFIALVIRLFIALVILIAAVGLSVALTESWRFSTFRLRGHTEAEVRVWLGEPEASHGPLILFYKDMFGNHHQVVFDDSGRVRDVRSIGSW